MPTEMAKALLRGEISNGCGCDFCTGKKKHEDNWCAHCASVRLQPPKHWENLDVCDDCEKLIRVQVAIDRLRDLPNDWGGSEKPSERACDVASELVRLMGLRGHRALDAAPIADGGIAVYYVEEAERHAHFDVYNDGGSVVVTGRGSAAWYAELADREAVDAMCRYLGQSL